MSAYELAQLNIGIIKGPMDSPLMAEFAANLARINFEIMRRRREWFERMSELYVVLWWVPRGHRPSVAEAIERLQELRRKGPHREAFTFGQLFPAPDAPPGARPIAFNDPCPAS